MSCNGKHTWDEHGLCFECNRPQNAIHTAQEWMNDHDADEPWSPSRADRAMADARDIIEWLLEDLENN